MLNKKIFSFALIFVIVMAIAVTVNATSIKLPTMVSVELNEQNYSARSSYLYVHQKQYIDVKVTNDFSSESMLHYTVYKFEGYDQNPSVYFEGEVAKGKTKVDQKMATENGNYYVSIEGRGRLPIYYPCKGKAELSAYSTSPSPSAAPIYTNEPIDSLPAEVQTALDTLGEKESKLVHYNGKAYILLSRGFASNIGSYIKVNNLEVKDDQIIVSAEEASSGPLVGWAIRKMDRVISIPDENHQLKNITVNFK